MKSFIIYFSKKGSVEQLFNQAWYLFPEEYLFRIQYWASRRMCWLKKVQVSAIDFQLTDEVQNPNKTRQLFLLAYQLAKDLIWVFSVSKLELTKPLLLMVFDFGHGFLSEKNLHDIFIINEYLPKSLPTVVSLLDDFEIPLLQTLEHHFQIRTRSQYLPKYTRYTTW